MTGKYTVIGLTGGASRFLVAGVFAGEYVAAETVAAHAYHLTDSDGFLVVGPDPSTPDGAPEGYALDRFVVDAGTLAEAELFARVAAEYGAVPEQHTASQVEQGDILVHTDVHRDGDALPVDVVDDVRVHEDSGDVEIRFEDQEEHEDPAVVDGSALLWVVRT